MGCGRAGSPRSAGGGGGAASGTLHQDAVRCSMARWKGGASSWLVWAAHVEISLAGLASGIQGLGFAASKVDSAVMLALVSRSLASLVGLASAPSTNRAVALQPGTDRGGGILCRELLLAQAHDTLAAEGL